MIRLAARRTRILRRFKGDERGSTAVEFGLVSLPLFAFLFAILEGAIVFWANSVLNEAVSDASRDLYTGRFQQATATTSPAETQALFKTAICERISGLVDCTNLKIDVQSYDVFPSAIPWPIVVDEAGNRKLDPAFGVYNAPQPYRVTLVRAAVEFPVFMSVFDANKSNLSGGKRLLMGSAVFRTEQYFLSMLDPDKVPFGGGRIPALAAGAVA